MRRALLPRRLTNLELMDDVASMEAWDVITLDGWGARALNDGEPPRRGK